jgi:Zn-dependent peptidase ImmA (M78 family)
MNVMRTTKPNFNRRTIATQAMQAAIATRAKAKLDQSGAICIYSLSDALGVTVRFNDINMEGMYERSNAPRIHLSARRPLSRRTYNCAHELGHHIFGHGSSIDELREDAKENPWEDPKEFLADTFAGYILMPIIGIKRAFAQRGWTPEAASPIQLYTIACEFGVGYNTLITHLSFGVNLITRARAVVLQRSKPKSLRNEILSSITPEPLVVADLQRVMPSIDAEVKTLLLLPHETETTGAGLVHERDLSNGRLFRAVRPGIVQASADNGAWAIFVRIAPEAYVGLAKYRHLEVDADE